MEWDKKGGIVRGATLGAKLLEVMGIDPHCVVSLSLSGDPKSGVTVEVKRFLTMTGADGLLEGMNSSVVTERFDVNKLAGKAFARKLLEEMGLDWQQVKGFTIRCVPNDGVTINIVRFITPESAEGLISVLADPEVTKFSVNKQED